jgi:hypothetical protein
VERWVSATNISDVALEVLDIDGIETDDGLHLPVGSVFGHAPTHLEKRGSVTMDSATYRIKSHISFGDLVAKVEWIGILRQMLLSTIEGLEQSRYGLLVCFLCTT